MPPDSVRYLVQDGIAPYPERGPRVPAPGVERKPAMTLELTRSEGKQRLAFWSGQDYEGGFVYLIQGERHTPVKLGYSTNVPRRVRELQCSNPAELHVLDVVPGTEATERQMHKHLAPYRLRHEWFRYEEAIAAWMAFRLLADQAVQFFLATGRVPRLEALDGWHELVDAARPPEAHLTPPDVMAYPPSIGWTNRRQRTTKFFPR